MCPEGCDREVRLRECLRDLLRDLSEGLGSGGPTGGTEQVQQFPGPDSWGVECKGDRRYNGVPCRGRVSGTPS